MQLCNNRRYARTIARTENILMRYITERRGEKEAEANARRRIERYDECTNMRMRYEFVITFMKQN